MNIKVNGIPYEYEGDQITYEALVKLAWQTEPRPAMDVTVMWPYGAEYRHWRGLSDRPLQLEPGISFTVEPRT
jgi:hypothetical protein